jgi:hypothetical protein
LLFLQKQELLKMGRLLNKLLLIFLLTSLTALSQEEKSGEKDYLDKGQFIRYRKRADQLASWQIQNLKFGALVVRLQSNQLKTDACKRTGNHQLAKKIIAETQFYNKTVMKAYLQNYNFSKVYFIYAQNSDSLLRGSRKGIFLDTTLSVNQEIVMNENYYLIAEKDYVYNSSIGFVKEDSAIYVKESGSRTIEAPIVLKNKYGHQLKKPFPFYINRSVLRSSSLYDVTEIITYEGGKPEPVSFEIGKDVSSEKQGLYVADLNDRLHLFYNKEKSEQINDPRMRPFLY